jgi:hypothetical protein
LLVMRAREREKECVCICTYMHFCKGGNQNWKSKYFLFIKSILWLW